jgi:pantetheine-phosphate adenylyltransferase
VSRMRAAIYAGSFDPMTFGHLDLVRRAVNLFPRLVVAVGRHPTRDPLFSVNERLEMMKAVCAPIEGVEVASFDGLLVDFAKILGVGVLVRGLRVGADFEYELQMAQANVDLAPELDTIFLPTRTNYGFVTGSLVRDIARHGGDVARYAPPEVCEALEGKFSRR